MFMQESFMEYIEAGALDSVSRRKFLTQAVLAFGALATMSALSNRLRMITGNPRNQVGTTDSIFQPRIGSRLNYWRNKLGNLRLR